MGDTCCKSKFGYVRSQYVFDKILNDVPKEERKCCAECSDKLGLVYEYAYDEYVKTLENGLEIRNVFYKWTGEFGGSVHQDSIGRRKSSFCNFTCALRYAEKKALEENKQG